MYLQSSHQQLVAHDSRKGNTAESCSTLLDKLLMPFCGEAIFNFIVVYKR